MARRNQGVASELDAERPPPSRKPRWGVRTMWLLGMVGLCALATSWLDAAGNTGWASVTGLGAWVGLVGAAYCSYRGLRGASWLPR